MGSTGRSSFRFSILILLAIPFLLAACGDSSDPAGPGPGGDDGGDRWVIEYGASDTDDLLSMWGAAPDDIWAVSVTGVLLHFNGDGWQRVDPWDREAVALWKVWGLSADAVWAVGDDGTVLHYDGRTWRFMPRVDSTQLRSIWGTASDKLWAVSADSRVFHYDGAGWDMVYDHSDALVDITGTGPENIYACGYSNSVLHFDGDDWTPMTLPPVGPFDLWSLSIDDQDRVWTCGGSGTVFRYDDGTWTEQSTPTTETLLAIECHEDRVFVLGFDGTILRHNGSEWGTMTSGVSAWLRAVQVIGLDDIFVGGDYGTLIHWDGESWDVVFQAAMMHLEEVWVGPEGSAFAVGSTILRREDGAWIDDFTPVSNVVGVWGRNAQDVYVVGGLGYVYHYDGTDWATTDTGTGLTLYAVRGAATGPVYAVGLNGVVLELENDTWQVIPTGVTNPLFDLWVGEDGTLVVVGADIILRRDPTTEEWSREYAGYHWSHHSITAAPDGTLYTQCHEKVFVNSGDQWSMLPFSGDRIKRDLHADGSGRLWACGDDGRIYCYEDGLWRVDSRPCSPPLTSIHGNAADDLFAVGVEGRIFRYDP